LKKRQRRQGASYWTTSSGHRAENDRTYRTCDVKRGAATSKRAKCEKKDNTEDTTVRKKRTPDQSVERKESLEGKRMANRWGGQTRVTRDWKEESPFRRKMTLR